MTDIEREMNERAKFAKEHRLTDKQVEALSAACWGLKHFGGGVCTNSQIRKRTMLALKARDLVSSTSAVACDGDGFHLEPERWGVAWRPTEKGIEFALRLHEIDENEAARLRKALTDD